MRLVGQHKLNGHALLSALIISIVISITLASFLLINYYNRERLIRNETNERLRRNVQSAINLVIADSLKFNKAGDEQLDLFGDNTDSVSITRDFWGVYNVACIKAFNSSKSFSKIFFYGIVLSDTLNACLYLADHQRPLQVSGNTKLVGDAFLPNRGIKPADIEGNSYKGKELVLGNIVRSDSNLTMLNRYLVRHGYDLISLCRNKEVQNNSLLLEDSIINSFENETKYYFINSVNKLVGQKIKGKVILFSDSLIEISSSVRLEDAIVIAPEIHLADGFSGSVQLIAEKEIKVGNKCRLNYPSSIILLKDTLSNSQGIIEVGDSTFISGLLFANALKADPIKNMVSLEKGSVIEGVVYIQGFLQAKGTIYGTILTDYFIYKGVLATYENSLVDAIIDRGKLSPHFISPALIKIPGRLNIIKWLH